MDCLEFRRRCGAEPQNQGAEFLAHAAECAACSMIASKAARFDDLIRDALRIDVPADDSRAERSAPRRVGDGRRRWWIGMAASVVLAVAIGVSLLPTSTDRQAETLGDAIIAHLRHEPEAFGTGLAALDAATVQQTLARHRVRLGEQAGAVVYLRMCLVDGREIPHLVVQSSSGPVTVMLFGGERVGERLGEQVGEPGGEEGEIGAGRLSGRIVPISGGSVAIVGHGQPVDASTEAQIISAVGWEV